jgi:NAD(P)-dependent dehydrogenase (short-subunit alcohol dehydrogenase family)
MALDFAGKTAIVTGGGSGIGRAACLQFGRAGASVVVADIVTDQAAAVAREIEDAGGTALPVSVDVTDIVQVTAMADAALESYGRIDALYANAGIEGAGSAADMPLDDWYRVLNVNLTGVFLSIRAVLPGMIAGGGGAIVAQSSTAALVGVANLAAYSAAKGGVTALARQIAVEYGPQNIRANAICPGTVWTPLVERTYVARGGDETFGSRAQMTESASRSTPLRRLGTPDEVASLAVYLCSDDAAWMTGSVLTADGGFTAR